MTALFVASGLGCSSADSPGRLLSSPSSVKLGVVDCGEASSTESTTISNDREDSTLTWTADVEGPFVLEGPAAGTLRSFESSTVFFHAAVPSTVVAGLPLTGSLRFHTNDPNEPVVTIPLSVTPRGATLVMPSSPVEFGDIPVSATSPSVAGAIRNVGNAPADIVVGVPSDPQFAAQTKSLFVLPGSTSDVAMTFSPTTWGTVDASLPVTVKGPVCGALPPMMLRGRGTKGVVLTSPGSLDFGLVDCGGTASPKKVTVENKGDAAFDLDASLKVGTSFTVAPTKATVAPGGSIELTVTPNAVPQISAVTPDLYADTLTVTTNAAGDFPHVVALHETAYGVDLSFVNPPPVVRVRVDDVKTLWFDVKNDGNATAYGFGSPGNVVSGTGVVPPGVASVAVEFSPDPAKLGMDRDVPLIWSLKGAPVCGSVPKLVKVRAWDTVVDFDSGDRVMCAIGHTRRVYCWGDNNDGHSKIPFPQGTYPTPELVVGETADNVMMGWPGPWLRATSGGIREVSYWQGVNVRTFFLPGPVKQLAPSTGGGGNDGWCALTPAGDMKCVGVNANGQWGNGGECWVTNATPVSAFYGFGPFDSMNLGMFGVHAIRAGEVFRSMGCTNGNPSFALAPQKVPGLANVAEVESDSSSVCARFVNGTVTCWPSVGPTDPDGTLVVGLNDAVDVAVRERGYAVRPNGTIVAFATTAGTASTVSGLTNPVVFKGSCGTRSDGALLCVGSSYLSPFAPVAGFEGP